MFLSHSTLSLVSVFFSDFNILHANDSMLYVPLSFSIFLGFCSVPSTHMRANNSLLFLVFVQVANSLIHSRSFSSMIEHVGQFGWGLSHLCSFNNSIIFLALSDKIDKFHIFYQALNLSSLTFPSAFRSPSKSFFVLVILIYVPVLSLTNFFEKSAQTKIQIRLKYLKVIYQMRKP